nr:hypothetical protein [Tanacetum cinerariifolium]
MLHDAQDDDDKEDKGDDDEDDQEEGSDDEQASDKEDEEFIHPNLIIHDEEETIDEESFDPILKTPKNTDDEGNGKENLGTNVGREEGHDEEDEEDELYRDVNINLGRGVQMADVHTTQESKDTHVTLTSVNHDGIESILETTSQMDVQTPTSVAPLPVFTPTLTPSTISTVATTQQALTSPITAPSTLLQDLPNFSSLFGFDHRLKTLKTVNKQLKAKFLTRSSNSSKTSYAVAADLSKMELKKILIEKIEGNKSLHRFNKQRNLYKELVEAYESEKFILDTYEDTVTLKRRHDDDTDKDKEAFGGSDRGSKRKKEKSQSQQALQRRKLPRALASRHKGL